MVGSTRIFNGQEYSYVLGTHSKREAKKKAEEMRLSWHYKCRVTHESDGRYYVWIPHPHSDRERERLWKPGKVYNWR